MTERKVPVQSLIDHIKTAVDVDPWAKALAEELLNKQVPVKAIINCDGYYLCGVCKGYVAFPNGDCKKCYCEKCGQAVKWE